MIRKFFLLSISLFVLLSCTESEINYINQADNSQRYNSQVFETITITKDIRYGANVTQNGTTKGLDLDIYQPTNDTETRRPLLILAHGGSFTSGNKSDLSDFATLFAKAGYVVASINYRLIDVTPSQLVFKKAVINAVVDMKAAVRFFNKDLATNNKYKIDTDNIFIGGYSAGAITALHYGYVNNDTELTAIGGTSFVNYVKSKGGLEGTSGNENFSSKIKGIINISGALFSASFINLKEPTIYSIHGTADQVVPYSQGNVSNTGIITEGSGVIHSFAKQIGIHSELKTITSGKHDAFFNCNSCFVEIRSFLYSQLK